MWQVYFKSIYTSSNIRTVKHCLTVTLVNGRRIGRSTVRVVPTVRIVRFLCSRTIATDCDAIAVELLAQALIFRGVVNVALVTSHNRRLGSHSAVVEVATIERFRKVTRATAHDGQHGRDRSCW
jgi:hypothetical protein